MIPAPNIKIVQQHGRNYPEAMCGILFAPLFSSIAKDNIIQRIGYLDERSQQYIHFYCAGFGGYWNVSHYPDMQQIGTYTSANGVTVPWSFSQKEFGKFINEMQSISK